MSELYGLNLQPMSNKLVNYGVTENGIAVIELASDSAGKPLQGEGSGPNTYTHEMMRDIDEAVVKARFDDDVTVIVLTGNGEKFFSAGASIQMLNSVSPGFKYNFCLHANETLSRLEQTPKLVICAMNGHAVGGGLEIAMAADIRIARKNAGKVDYLKLGLAGTVPRLEISRNDGHWRTYVFEDDLIVILSITCGKAVLRISEEMFLIGQANSHFQIRRLKQLETSSVQSKLDWRYRLNIILLSKENCKQHYSIAVMRKKESQHMLRKECQNSKALDEQKRGEILSTDYSVPADVPDDLADTYLSNLDAATAGTGFMNLFACDQKIEHLNDDFYDGEMIPLTQMTLIYLQLHMNNEQLASSGYCLIAYAKIIRNSYLLIQNHLVISA